MSNIFTIDVTKNNGTKTTLSEYAGKFLLIVNTASKCGFTPQYDGLEKIYKSLKDKLVVLAFPCNQFGSQEPGSDEEIQTFCQTNFNLTFPVFSKIDVNGDDAHPLFKHLKKEAPGILGTEQIKWNFTKFLISPEGKVLKRYAPTDSPEKIQKEVEELIKNSST